MEEICENCDYFKSVKLYKEICKNCDHFVLAETYYEKRTTLVSGWGVCQKAGTDARRIRSRLTGGDSMWDYETCSDFKLRQQDAVKGFCI